MKKLQLFDQNHGLSTLQKCQFCLLFKSMFILSRKACLLTRTSPYTFSGCILHKTKRSKNFKVSTKTMDHGPKRWTLCKNANFVGFWNRCVFLFKKACLLSKTSKIIFSRFFFTIYDMGIRGGTRGYRGLQGVTRGYKRLQGVTGGYKGLQGVTGGDKGLQGVTKDYTNFFLTTRFPDTFSWFILHKNQSWRNL